jgi:polar amino acid transport system substrate-binding protein
LTVSDNDRTGASTSNRQASGDAGLVPADDFVLEIRPTKRSYPVHVSRIHLDRDHSMDRRTYVQLAGAGGTLGLAGCLSTFGGSDELVAGTASGFPPFEMTEGGDLVGFDIDLLEAVVAETDSEIGEWEDFNSFDSLIPGLQNDRIDVIAAAMTISDEREQSIDFTDPYYDANQAILVREGGDFQPSSLDDLPGHVVGAQRGTTGECVVQDELIEPGDLDESNYRGYDNYTLAVTDLENGNVDAVVLDTPVAATFAEDRNVVTAFTYETGEQYGFGVRDGADDLREALNDGLATVMDDGTYEELTREWFQ